MIVFDLQCGSGHVFEAWFASSGAYEDQREAGQVRCPLCDDPGVSKAVMAPNLASKANRRADAPGPAAAKEAMRALAQAQKQLLAQSTWVGRDFADKARAMHLGEVPKDTIHGQATLADAKALLEDGVAVAPLPLPVVPPKSSN